MTVAAAAFCLAAASSCREGVEPQQERSDEALLYALARRELPDQDRLEQQVEDYRRDLYIQTYLNQKLLLKVEAVADEDCKAFYDRYGKDLKLDEPILKGLLVKLPLQNKKNQELHNWLTQLSQGKEECMADLERFCAQKASVYDNFCNQWVRLDRLTDQIPLTIVDPRQFLAIKAFETTDADFEYHFVITDYRLAGEVQPYEWARQGILELLIQQRRETFQKELVDELRGNQQADTTTTENRK